MKSIDVKYFALLREEAGKESETLSVTCSTYRELYEEIKKKNSFSLPVEMIRVAVNDEFTRIDAEVMNGARVVFIPPVAGG